MQLDVNDEQTATRAAAASRASSAACSVCQYPQKPFNISTSPYAGLPIYLIDFER
jgi:hypothetical protein